MKKLASLALCLALVLCLFSAATAETFSWDFTTMDEETFNETFDLIRSTNQYGCGDPEPAQPGDFYLSEYGVATTIHGFVIPKDLPGYNDGDPCTVSVLVWGCPQSGAAVNIGEDEIGGYGAFQFQFQDDPGWDAGDVLWGYIVNSSSLQGLCGAVGNETIGYSDNKRDTGLKFRGWFWVKFELLDNGDVRGKVWPEDGDEPAEWTLEATYAALTDNDELRERAGVPGAIIAHGTAEGTEPDFGNVGGFHGHLKQMIIEY